MQLMTKAIENRLSKFPYRSQEGKGLEAEVIVKYFGGSSATWLITEGDQQEDGDWEFYGYVTLDGSEWEWGYFQLSEIMSLRFRPFGLGAERDLYMDKHAKVKDFVKVG